jgi:hypothetical protein
LPKDTGIKRFLYERFAEYEIRHLIHLKITL